MIHEAFKGFEVRFYLAVIVEGESEVVVVFPVSTYLASPRCCLVCLLTPVRNSYQIGKYWKKSGEVRGAVYTIQSHNAVQMHDRRETREIERHSMQVYPKGQHMWSSIYISILVGFAPFSIFRCFAASHLAF